jgi:hypothetical protein
MMQVKKDLSHLGMLHTKMTAEMRLFSGGISREKRMKKGAVKKKDFFVSGRVFLRGTVMYTALSS